MEQKKGADKGIDGRLYFRDGKESQGIKQAIFSVKAGENISAPMVRDLVGVIQRENAALGVLILMHEPTKPMRKEATDGGFYVSPAKTKHPKIQILTVGELLAGKRIDMPMWEAVLTYKPARRVKEKKLKQPTLPMLDATTGVA